jgi:hypothetical protein
MLPRVRRGKQRERAETDAAGVLCDTLRIQYHISFLIIEINRPKQMHWQKSVFCSFDFANQCDWQPTQTIFANILLPAFVETCIS